MPPPRPFRSLLFVPGARQELFAKAAASAADALVLDLEDSVSAGAKDIARDCVAAELARSQDRMTFVRINHPASGELDRDLSALAPHGAQAVMVPKVQGPQDIEEIDRRLARHERETGLAPDAIGVVAVIETCLGLRNLFDTIRSAPRIRGVGLASAEQGDLMVDIGGQWTPGGEAMAYARGKFVCDARAAGCDWLIDGAFMDLTSETALESEARMARMLGFTGKIAVHPRQVATINDVFSPTEAEVERAEGLLAALREAEERGHGAIKFRGMMVDDANARWARQVLARAGR